MTPTFPRSRPGPGAGRGFITRHRSPPWPWSRRRWTRWALPRSHSCRRRRGADLFLARAPVARHLRGSYLIAFKLPAKPPIAAMTYGRLGDGRKVSGTTDRPTACGMARGLPAGRSARRSGGKIIDHAAVAARHGYPYQDLSHLASPSQQHLRRRPYRARGAGTPSRSSRQRHRAGDFARSPAPPWAAHPARRRVTDIDSGLGRRDFWRPARGDRVQSCQSAAFQSGCAATGDPVAGPWAGGDGVRVSDGVKLWVKADVG